MISSMNIPAWVMWNIFSLKWWLFPDKDPLDPSLLHYIIKLLLLFSLFWVRDALQQKKHTVSLMSSSSFLVKLLVDNRKKRLILNMQRATDVIWNITKWLLHQKDGKNPSGKNATKNVLFLTYTNQFSAVNINSVSKMAN